MAHNVMMIHLINLFSYQILNDPSEFTLITIDTNYYRKFFLFSYCADSDKLYPGETLTTGMYLMSTDGQNKAIMQSDGNFKIYINGVCIKRHFLNYSFLFFVLVVPHLWQYLIILSVESSSVLDIVTTLILMHLKTKKWIIIYCCIWSYNMCNFIFSTIAGGRLGFNTHNNPGAYVKHQTDGNVVVYSASGAALWATNTHGQSTSYLIMQTDRHLVLYRPDGSACWGHWHWYYEHSWIKLCLASTLLSIKY